MTPDEARAIAAPDSWPWPMSEDAKRWVAWVGWVGGKSATKQPECFPEKDSTVGGDFNHEEHERFMRGLG